MNQLSGPAYSAGYAIQTHAFLTRKAQADRLVWSDSSKQIVHPDGTPNSDLALDLLAGLLVGCAQWAAAHNISLQEAVEEAEERIAEMA